MTEYYNYLVDDDDDDDYDDNDDYADNGVENVSSSGVLDTSWITEYEKMFLMDEYKQFIRSDVTRVSFQFIYLDSSKKDVVFMEPLFYYSLLQPNQISQGEIFRLIQPRQRINGDKKKYYNFLYLCFYDFYLPDDFKSVAEYLSSDKVGNDGGRLIEYTNILSFDTIPFRPLIHMFHDMITFTVVLFED